jgi:hypothetical protein
VSYTSGTQASRLLKTDHESDKGPRTSAEWGGGVGYEAGHVEVECGIYLI